MRTKKKNTNKARGLRFENMLKDHFVSLGYYVVRSAASKSLVDLVVLCEDHTILVQCKSTKTLKEFPIKITSRHKEFNTFGKLSVDNYVVKYIFIYSYPKDELIRFLWIEDRWERCPGFINLKTNKPAN